MSKIGTIITGIETALTAAAPGRAVTRDLNDFSDRNESDLKNGIFTLLASGLKQIPGEDELMYNIPLSIVGQVLATNDDDTGSTVEELELLMIDDINRLVSGITGIRLKVESARQSMQVEAPYGWIAFDLLAGPLDFEDIDISSLADFITFHAESQLDADAEPELITEEALPQ